ncbi:ATP-binding protein [Kitasatospora kifunensis]|uniref:Anti-sigma regulatory factor (Ser/Thr protein kinase) n=1 Tax=Kitasatospora kifunensis TaxID=58351 RepID=A0A7W7VSW4_KITKI|nr:ATP-binding protein [Kitasatospora kifunensis]MBB4921567.1 anti-sigma regulatory factor (Ser/Thr protein kinase) [Kitasatospora kifunensis]
MPETPDQPPAPSPRPTPSPSPTAKELTWLTNNPQTPAAARRLLLDFLPRIRGGERFADKGQLLVSELVTNALVHATRRDQLIRLGLEADMDADRLWISVEDPSDKVPQQQHKNPDEESGRGLLLVDALSEEWGWGPREGIGKQVWCSCAPDPVVCRS